MKEFQNEVDVIRQSRDDAVSAAKETERKLKNQETELLQLREDLAASERARKAAEAERDELQEEVSNSGSGK